MGVFTTIQRHLSFLEVSKSNAAVKRGDAGHLILPRYWWLSRNRSLATTGFNVQ